MLSIVTGNAHRTEAPLVDPDWRRAMERRRATETGSAT
jgi:hypothetical protein